jgi:hypothetical protein
MEKMAKKGSQIVSERRRGNEIDSGGQSNVGRNARGC